jgi:tRNA-2-methylthio-N6-dimethylallyladenosine synthase
MNEYDSRKLAKLMEAEYDLVDSPDQADVIIVNTCSVREKPEQKLFSVLGEVRELRDGKKDVLIGVGGCVAQQEGAQIIDRSRKNVDFVFGTHNLSLVPSLIESVKNGAGPQVAVDYRDEWEDLPLGFGGNPTVSAFVSISRGCNKNCSYCIVPRTRGKEVSRDPLEIEREVRIAVHRGSKEIVLLGQTVNSYGLDFSPRIRFSDLLRRVAAVKGVERIRFTSPHPQEVREDFIECVTSEPKVCRHIHLPLQSGSDTILKAMNRNYRRKRYLKIVEMLKAKVPDMGISSDIIVGFPGETRKDFEDTLEIMREVGFQHSYSFMFSKRPGTPASQLEETVSPEEKKERLQELQKLQDELTQKALALHTGSVLDVLLERPTPADSSLLQGRTTHNMVVNLIAKHSCANLGETVPVRMESPSKHTLRGVVDIENKVEECALRGVTHAG